MNENYAEICREGYLEVDFQHIRLFFIFSFIYIFLNYLNTVVKYQYLNQQR